MLLPHAGDEGLDVRQHDRVRGVQLRQRDQSEPGAQPLVGRGVRQVDQPRSDQVMGWEREPLSVCGQSARDVHRSYGVVVSRRVL